MNTLIKFSITSLVAIIFCLLLLFLQKTNLGMNENLIFIAYIIVVISSVLSGIYFSKLMHEKLIHKRNYENIVILIFLIIAGSFYYFVHSGNINWYDRSHTNYYSITLLFPLIMFGMFLIQNFRFIIFLIFEKLKNEQKGS